MQEKEELLQQLGDGLPEILGELSPELFKTAETRDGVTEVVGVTTKNIWRHPLAHPLVLDLMLLDDYGQQYLDWEPEALKETLVKDGKSPSQSSWTKIQAVRVLHQSPGPWRQWETFHMVSRGLSGKQPSIIWVEEPELGHLAVAVDIMKLVDRDRYLGEDLQKFVAAAAMNYGVPWLPEPLAFAVRELRTPKICCGKCGTTVRDDHDQACVHCGEPNPQPVADELLELRQDLERQWEAYKDKPLETAVEGLVAGSAVAIPAYKLLIHWDYRNRVRANLVQQLRMLSRGSDAGNK